MSQSLIDFNSSGTVSWVHSEDSDEQITAHTGFIGQYNSVREDVWEIVNERLEKFGSTSEIFIAGHSMGGALTTLCTLDFSCNKSRLLKNNVTSKNLNYQMARNA